MELPQIVKDALDLFQQLEPGMANAVKVGGYLGTMGSAAVKIVQKGQKLVTFWIGKAKPKKPSTPAPAPAQAEKPAAWVTPVDENELLTTKENVAILVDINRRALQDVAAFLAQKEIDADLFVVTNDPLYRSETTRLNENNPAEWVEIVQEFNAAVSAIKYATGRVHMHIFLSTPVALAYGLGCAWGTVDQAMVYHWTGKEYCSLMPISRDLRFGQDT